MNDLFSEGQVEQLEGAISRVVRPIIKEEVRSIVREEVRAEVASQLSIQLKPINDKLNQIIETEKEDTDALNSVVMQNTEDIKRIERHLNFPVAA